MALSLILWNLDNYTATQLLGNIYSSIEYPNYRLMNGNHTLASTQSSFTIAPAFCSVLNFEPVWQVDATCAPQRSWPWSKLNCIRTVVYPTHCPTLPRRNQNNTTQHTRNDTQLNKYSLDWDNQEMCLCPARYRLITLVYFVHPDRRAHTLTTSCILCMLNKWKSVA